MKKIILTISLFIFFVGCSSQPNIKKENIRITSFKEVSYLKNKRDKIPGMSINSPAGVLFYGVVSLYFINKQDTFTYTAIINDRKYSIKTEAITKEEAKEEIILAFLNNSL
jgi:hypothetical protein